MTTVRSIPLGDALKSANPGFASGEQLATGVVQLRMNNVTVAGTLDWSAMRRVPSNETKSQKYGLAPGDVVFSHTNSPELVGKAALFTGFKEPVVFSNHFLRLRVDEANLHPRYLALWLNFQWKRRIFESLCTQWVNQATVRCDDLLDLEITLPALAEQKRIVAILERADRLRRLRRYGLEMGEAFLPAVFAASFGDDNRGRWKEVQLDELIRDDDKINYGVVQPGFDLQEGVPIIRVADLDDLEKSRAFLKRVDPKIDEKHSASRIQGDELLIACVGSIGKVAKAAANLKGCNIARAVARVRCDWTRINRDFLAHYLTTPRVQDYFTKETRTVSQPTLNILQITEAPIILPPREMQNRFAAHAIRFEHVRAIHRESLRQAEHLFQTLLHRAFTSGL